MIRRPNEAIKNRAIAPKKLKNNSKDKTMKLWLVSIKLKAIVSLECMVKPLITNNKKTKDCNQLNKWRIQHWILISIKKNKPKKYKVLGLKMMSELAYNKNSKCFKTWRIQCSHFGQLAPISWQKCNSTIWTLCTPWVKIINRRRIIRARTTIRESSQVRIHPNSYKNKCKKAVINSLLVLTWSKTHPKATFMD